MVKREKLLLIFTGFMLFLVIFSYVVNNPEVRYTDYNNINNNVNTSASLEGIENVVITKVRRDAIVGGFGLYTIEDSLTIKNLNNKPISSFFFGIPLDVSEDLIFLEVTGADQNTLLAERSSIIMNEHEMIVAYFDSPLLPHQSTVVKFTHIYKNLIQYNKVEDQSLLLVSTIYPLVPYKMELDLLAIFNFPDTAEAVEAGWGFVNPTLAHIQYNFDLIKDEFEIDYISPFLENLDDRKGAIIFFIYNDHTKLEMIEINREISISAWGIIRVNEEFSLKNKGFVEITEFSIKIPEFAKNLYVFDDLGEILGITIESGEDTSFNNVIFNLIQGNRIRIKENSTFKFNVEYYLPFENHVSLNWFQESIQIDLLTTIYEYLGRKQTITIIIDGCHNIGSITESPEAIQKSLGATKLTYKADYVTPPETRTIQITFTIDLFSMVLRPIIFIIIISLIASIFVIIIKTRKREEDVTALKKEFIPVNEIREYCSLYEEKNALTIEIRQAEEDTKRKKIAKKRYKNILDKNTSKIDEIHKEIIPFKEALIEISDVFENIVKKLDIFEAERISVKDSITLLESRYKRGRLPSRAAYIKLSDDFKKRRKKIDRSIDRLIQQLRSYLL